MQKCADCYFCSTIAIFFVVQMKFFWCAVQIFWCAGKFFFSSPYKLLPQVCCLLVQVFVALWCEDKFCRLMARVLLPYVKFLKHSTKVCCIFLGVGGWWCKSLSMDSLLLSKI